MTTTAPKAKRYRSPNKLKPTDALQSFYHNFLKPFLGEFKLHEGQKQFEEGVEAFFNVEARPILWCRATSAFRMPGKMWRTPSEPYTLVEGVGRRQVTVGSAVVVRLDAAMPARVDVEFDDQVFVLTHAELAVIQTKLKPVV